MAIRLLINWREVGSMAFMFEDLVVYKRSMEMVKKIFILRREIKDRIIVDQLSRAALSIPLNIAEGNGRIHDRERRQYFYTARGSLLECIPILQLCKEIGYIDENRYSEIYGLADEVGRLLNGLIRSVGK
jgi:four helix bundle protein